MTVKATLTAAFPEAQEISEILERIYGGSGSAIALEVRADRLWTVAVYLEGRGPDGLAEELRDRLGGDGFGATLHVEELPPTDWVSAGRDAIRQVAAGRFVLHGSHHRGQVPAGRVAIEIDASQAFGTGHHATTAGCLTVLDRLVRTRRFDSPLDLGTGSGVLAIALAKTLRRPVLASDIDPVAVRIARENAALNGVRHLVHVISAGGVDHAAIRGRAPFDIVVANILAEPLCRMAPRLVPIVARGGVLLLSGLLLHQRERVVATYRTHGATLREARTFAGWSVLVLERD